MAPLPYDYAEVFAAIPVPATLIDADGVILDVNQAFLDHARGMGRELRREDRVGAHVVDFVHSEKDRARFSAFIEVLLREGKAQHLLWTAETPSGRMRYVEIHAELLRGDGGVVKGALILREDVTEKTRAIQLERITVRIRDEIWHMRGGTDMERILIAVREGLRELGVPFNNCGVNLVEEGSEPPVVRFHSMADDGRWILTESARATQIVLRIWGERSVAHRPDLNDEDTYGELALIGEVFGQPVRSVVDVPFSQGTLAVSSVAPHAFSQDDIEILEAMVRVMSEGFERMLDLESLRESEERSRAVVEQSGESIFLVDVESKLIVDANSSMRELLGYSPEEMETLTLFDFVAHDREDVERQVQRILANRRHSLGERVYRRKDGSLVDVEVSVSVISYRGGEVMCVVARDITERRKAEQERRRTEQLESLGVLAGGIAHDFNNILTAILGNVSLAKLDVPVEEDMHTLLSDVEKATQRAANLTRQLLTFAKGGDPVRRATAVGELVREATDFALAGSNVRCEYELEEDVSLIEVDPGQISQVFQNLVINADQAMPDGGVIRITGRTTRLSDDLGHALPSGDYLELSIIDEGVGIPERHLQRIFEPYYTTKQRGSGLGLATAYAIVKNHGGHLEVESVIDAGTTFTIFLPAGPEEIHAAAGLVEEAPRGGGKILVMDDDEPVRLLASRILHHLGYEVEVTERGEEALAAYARAMKSGRPFAAAVLDLTIPGGMGGKETMQRLLELDPGVIAIASSGYSNDPVMSEFEAYGFRGVVAKPYVVAELSKTLNVAIAGDFA